MFRRFNPSSPISSYKQRDGVSKIIDYIDNKEYENGKICALQGLRRTGKSTMMWQTIAHYGTDKKWAFYVLQNGDTIDDITHVLDKEKESGTDIVFFDEVTRVKDFIVNSSVLADEYASEGMGIIVTGTDSLSLSFAADDELFDRVKMVYTTHIPFAEHCRVLGTDNMDDYIRFGGLMSKGIVESEVVIDEDKKCKYLDNAVSGNIANSIAKSYYGSPLEVLDKDDICKITERMVEIYSGAFRIKQMQDELDTATIDFPLKKAYKDKAVKDIIGRTVLREIRDFKVPIIEEYARRINARGKLSNNVTPLMVDKYDEYLRRMRVLSETDMFRFEKIGDSWESRIGDKEFYIVQPAVKYHHLVAACDMFLQHYFYKGLLKEGQEFFAKKLSEKIFGDMTEQIVLFDTKTALSKEKYCLPGIEIDRPRYKVGKPLFMELGKSLGEYDMIVCDEAQKRYWAFEIKHTSLPFYQQEMHLTNAEFMSEVNNAFGKRENVAVLYNGGSFVNSHSGIPYLNIADFSVLVDKYKDIEKAMGKLLRGLVRVNIQGLEGPEEIESLLRQRGVSEKSSFVFAIGQQDNNTVISPKQGRPVNMLHKKSKVTSLRPRGVESKESKGHGLGDS